MRPRSTRSFFGFWIVIVLAQLAGDAALFITTRSVRASLPGLGLGPAHLQADSLRRAASRYLRDSLGVTSVRRNDTVLVTVPPEARRSIDAQAGSAIDAGRSAAGWLLAGIVLLHIPLLLAIVAAVFVVRDRAREEENRALEEWRDSE